MEIHELIDTLEEYSLTLHGKKDFSADIYMIHFYIPDTTQLEANILYFCPASQR